MQKRISVEEAKKNNLWKIVPISSVPDDSPIIGITEYINKAFAEFNLCEEVLIPIIDSPLSVTPLVEAVEKHILNERAFRENMASTGHGIAAQSAAIENSYRALKSALQQFKQKHGV